eukprot:Nitzschia sp. Nitz4//scaffold18_size181773//109608//112496//NITZ4_001926-RA/size181773-processed-gene-0.56-mRNA-1//-1//CDS//3329540044//133//frame0
MVANRACVSPRDALGSVDFGTRQSSMSKGLHNLGGFNQSGNRTMQNNDSLLFNRSRSGGNFRRNKQQPDEADWGISQKRPSKPATPRSGMMTPANALRRSPNRLIQHQIENPTRLGEGGPLAKLTPTERLRSFDNGKKGLSINRSITPQRSRSMATAMGPSTPTNGMSRMTHSPRPKSRGKSRERESSRLLVVNKTEPLAPPMEDVTSQHHNRPQRRNSFSRESTIFPSARTPSQRKSLDNVGTEKNRQDYNSSNHQQRVAQSRGSGLALFKHGRMEQMEKEQRRQTQYPMAPRDDFDNDDYGRAATSRFSVESAERRNPQQSSRRSSNRTKERDDVNSTQRSTMTPGSVPVLNQFREAAKKGVDTIDEPIDIPEKAPKVKSISTWGIAEIVSDLSCSSAGLSSFVRGTKPAETKESEPPVMSATQRLQQALVDAKNNMYPQGTEGKEGSGSMESNSRAKRDNGRYPNTNEAEATNTRPHGGEKHMPQMGMTSQESRAGSITPQPSLGWEPRRNTRSSSKKQSGSDTSAPRARSNNRDPMWEVGISTTGIEVHRPGQHSVGSSRGGNKAGARNEVRRHGSPTPEKIVRSGSETPRQRNGKMAGTAGMMSDMTASTAETPGTPRMRRPSTPTMPGASGRSVTPTRAHPPVQVIDSTTEIQQPRIRPRSMSPNRLWPSRQKPTPGQILGETRQYVDKAEERLKAIQQKREAEEQLIAARAQQLATQQAHGVQLPKEQKSVVKKIFNSFGGKSDKKIMRANSSGSLGNAAALGLIKGEGAGNRGQGVGPAGTHGGTAFGGGASPRSPRQSLSKRWFGRSREEVPSRPNFNIRNGSSTSFGGPVPHVAINPTGNEVPSMLSENPLMPDRNGSYQGSAGSSSTSKMSMIQQKTTFDSLMKAIESDRHQNRPNYAVVELGDEVDAIEAGSVPTNPQALAQDQLPSVGSHQGGRSTPRSMGRNPNIQLR